MGDLDYKLVPEEKFSNKGLSKIRFDGWIISANSMNKQIE